MASNSIKWDIWIQNILLNINLQQEQDLWKRKYCPGAGTGCTNLEREKKISFPRRNYKFPKYNIAKDAI